MRNWTLILTISILGACGQKSELSLDNASNDFCICFNAQTIGTVDERMSPCLQEIVDKKNNEWNDSRLTDPDSIKSRFSKFSLELMLDLTRSCDNYFIAINDLYDKGYLEDTTDLNRSTISELSNRIRSETNKDSIESFLHKKVYRLIQAREFDMALQSIDSIKSLDNTDYGANLACAYVLNQKGLHDKAVIERAIELSGNESLELYAELTRRKKRTARK